MKLCQYCNREFLPSTHNQIYCESECTRRATNRRIMDNYYERKENRRGKNRYCKFNSCITKLSRYNDDDYCSLHMDLQMDMSFMKEWV